MKEKSVTSKELRKFGIGLAVILGVIGGLFLWRGRSAGPYILYAAGLSLLLSIIRPTGLTPIHRFMSWLAPILAWINTRIILTLAFYILFTPIGLLVRLIRKDLLDQKIDKSAESYWIKRQDPPFDPETYKHQF